MDDEREIEGVVIMGGKEERSRSRSGSERSESLISLREPLLLVNNIRMNNTSQLAIVGANVCPIESLDYEYYSLSLVEFYFIAF